MHKRRSREQSPETAKRSILNN
jgi:hypothetical protein